MIIERLEVRDLVLQFKDGPYVMSHVTQKELAIRVLRLEAGDGAKGWGEIVRKPTLDPDRVAATESPLLRDLVGTDLELLSAGLRPDVKGFVPFGHGGVQALSSCNISEVTRKK